MHTISSILPRDPLWGAGSVAVLPCPLESGASSSGMLEDLAPLCFLRSMPASLGDHHRVPGPPPHAGTLPGRGRGEVEGAGAPPQETNSGSTLVPATLFLLFSHRGTFSFFLSSFLPPSLPSSLFFFFFFFNFESENNSSASSCMLPTPVYYTRERSLSLPTVLVIYCSMTSHFQNSPIKHIFSFGLGLPDKVLWIFYL